MLDPRSFAATAPLVVLVACAPDEITPADLGEVCGEPSPFRLLELDTDRALSFVGEIAHVEDRRVLQVQYQGDEIVANYPASERTEIWSVGECGESPLRIDENVRGTSTLAVWPDVLLGCRESTGEILTLDPNGVLPINVVFELEEDCRYEATPWGLVTVAPHDEDTGALMLHPYPDDPWTQTSEPHVLVDPIRIRAAPEHSWPAFYEVLAVFEDEVLLITPDDALMSFSMLDGAMTIEANDVREFDVSYDRRWLVWQDVAVTDDDPEWPEGAIYLLDRESGTTTHLADTALAYTVWSSLDFAAQGFARLLLGGFGTMPQRFFSLATGASFDVPPGHAFHMRAPDGRWVDAGLWGYGPFQLFELETREAQPLFEHEGSLDLIDDRLFILQSSAHTLLNDHWRAQGRLWSVGLDGDRELLAERAAPFYRLTDDDGVITVLDLDRRWRGDLIAVLPGSRDERLVDTDVAPAAWVLEDGETILYGVSDDERTGVWLARVEQ
jgi:hypothetical protein